MGRKSNLGDDVIGALRESCTHDKETMGIFLVNENYWLPIFENVFNSNSVGETKYSMLGYYYILGKRNLVSVCSAWENVSQETLDSIKEYFAKKGFSCYYDFYLSNPKYALVVVWTPIVSEEIVRELEVMDEEWKRGVKRQRSNGNSN